MEIYGPGYTFQIGLVTMCTNTGTSHPHLTGDAAEALVAAGVACVGIDSLNIDATADGRRPVHTILLAAGIPIVEHLTNLAALPPAGFSFTAVPPKIEGAGTFTVRAFATIRRATSPTRPRSPDGGSS